MRGAGVCEWHARGERDSWFGLVGGTGESRVATARRSRRHFIADDAQ